VLDISYPSDDRGLVALSCPDWSGFGLEGLQPSLTLDGRDLEPRAAAVREAVGERSIEYRFDGDVRLTLTVEPAVLGSGAFVVRPVLELVRGSTATLNRLRLLTSLPNGKAAFGKEPRRVRVLLEQGYSARVAPLLAIEAKTASVSAEPNTEQKPQSGSSAMYWLAYDRGVRQAFLVGFLSSERFLGRVDITVAPSGKVERWEIGFDGGDTLMSGGRAIALEDFVLAVGADPWRLLEEYADSVSARHHPVFPDKPPVSWCSWYPYRLSVSDERILANARVAEGRLRPLGLTIMETDLGWETGYLPSSFQENAQFPRGLGWLARELGALGFDLGVWKAPYTVSEFDPVVKEHPEWLIQDSSGSTATSTFWTLRTPGREGTSRRAWRACTSAACDTSSRTS